MKRLALLLMLLASPLSAQTIIQQPTNQTAIVGGNASFTVTVSGGPCRSLWLINGHGVFGALDSTFTYHFTNVTLAQNATTVQIQIYGCPGPGSSTSQVAFLSVVPTLTLQSIAVTPTAPDIGIGQSQTLTATGTFSDGTKQDLTSTVVWTDDNPAVGALSGNTVSGLAIGTTIVTATSGTISGSTVLTVEPLLTISISATYEDGSVPPVRIAISKVATNPDGTTVSTGLFDLIPDATGASTGQLLIDSSMIYQAQFFYNDQPIAQPLSYSASLILAVMPKIAKVNFTTVQSKASGAINTVHWDAQ